MRATEIEYYHDDLYKLLDVKSNKEMVNFDDFVALVGI
jgi:hypothetical protein